MTDPTTISTSAPPLQAAQTDTPAAFAQHMWGSWCVNRMLQILDKPIANLTWDDIIAVFESGLREFEGKLDDNKLDGIRNYLNDHRSNGVSFFTSNVNEVAFQARLRELGVAILNNDLNAARQAVANLASPDLGFGAMPDGSIRAYAIQQATTGQYASALLLEQNGRAIAAQQWWNNGNPLTSAEEFLASVGLAPTGQALSGYSGGVPLVGTEQNAASLEMANLVVADDPMLQFAVTSQVLQRKRRAAIASKDESSGPEATGARIDETDNVPLSGTGSSASDSTLED